jgi:hypothetical protein
MGGEVQVGGGVDGDDALRGPRLGRVDPGDERVGDRGADEGGVQRVRPAGHDVADVGGGAGDQLGVLDAADGRSQDGSRHGTQPTTFPEVPPLERAC